MALRGTAENAGHVAANVRAELGRQSRTRRELAAALRVDEHRIYKRVSGRVPFTADEIAAVAQFLGTTVERLVEPDRTGGEIPQPRPAPGRPAA